jgi:hypothetical protein
MSFSETPPWTVAIIGPKFGTASQAIEAAVRNHVGDENVQSLWYEESAFERPLGRLIGRLVRVVAQALPLPQSARALCERFIATIRFRRKEAVAAQLAWAQSIGNADQLILVKPMFLRPEDLQTLCQLTQQKTVSIVLWDALWRTPSIKSLIEDTNAFSTEPTDCAEHGFTLLPLPPVRDLAFKSTTHSSEASLNTAPHSEDRTDIVRPVRLLFCGSWSLDRLLAARRMAAAIKLLEGDSRTLDEQVSIPRFVYDIHLVTANRAVSWLTKRTGFKSDSLNSDEYSKLVSDCDVLLDFGRAGQSSPSERMAAGMNSNKVVLSTNQFFGQVGFPFICVKNGRWREALLCSEQATIDRLPIKTAWATNEAAKRFTTTREEWARRVMGEVGRTGYRPSRELYAAAH